MQYTVVFWSTENDAPQYIGPFFSEDAANNYADNENQKLSLAGIPSSIANYSVIND